LNAPISGSSAYQAPTLLEGTSSTHLTPSGSNETVAVPRNDAGTSLLMTRSPNPCRRGCRSVEACACTPGERARYLARLSRPLLDRIDVHVEVPPVPYRELEADRPPGEGSAAVRKRVLAARERQRARFGRARVRVNARMTSRQVGRYCGLSAEGRQLLAQAVDRLGLSARAHDRVLKVSRTIGDLAGAEAIGVEHLAEALQYRGLERWFL